MELKIVDENGHERERAGVNGHGLGAQKAPLGRLLVDAGLATAEQVQAAAAESARTGELFGEVLLRLGLVSETDLGRLLAAQRGLPFVADPEVSESACELLPGADARETRALPLRVEGGRAFVGVADPSAERLARVQGLLPGLDVSFVVIVPSALDRGLAEHGRSRPTASTPAGADGNVDVARALAELEATRTELGAAAESLERTGHALRAVAGAASRAEHRLAVCERELASMNAEREREAGRAAALEERLVRGDEFVAELGAKLSELTRTVQAAGASGPA